MSIKRRPRFLLLDALVIAGALSLAAPSVTAKPAMSGPSVVPAGKTVVFKGSGFKPNEALTVAVTRPQGVEAHYAAVADAKGELHYKLAPNARGGHALRVLNSSGQAVSETRFVTP